MKMSGSQVIDAPRDAVWKGLNDPKVLQQCIPGCESIVASSPTQMSAKVVLKIGPVKAAFKGSVTLSDIKAPESYRISGKGEGGFAGFASGGATVKLTATSPSETLMEYDVDAQVGGKIAMLGIPSGPTTVDWNRVIFKALTIKGIYGREMFETWYKMIAMLQSGLDVRKVITHRMKAAEFAQGFALMKQGSCGKVVLDWST